MKKNFLLSLFFLILISCENTTESSKDNLNDLFNMTNSEMDKLMSCSVIMTLKTQKDKEEIEKTLEKFNSTLQEKVQGKIFTDMFEKCVDNIKEDTYSKIIKNLVVISQPDFTKDIEKLVDIDYSIYNENYNTNIYDITKIPNSIRIILFVCVFAILFIGTLYALKKLTYKPEKKKKKKN